MAFPGLRKWAAKYLRSNNSRHAGIRVRPTGFRPVIELLEDRVALSTFLVSNTNDSSVGSLRQAILDANANAGADLIQFNIPGSGVQTISPSSNFDLITDTVTIDGRSEGVFQGTPGYSGPPLIQLSGPGATMGVDGLSITGSNSSISGLIVNGFRFAIDLFTSGTSIKGNYIGTSSDGTVAAPNYVGIYIDGGSNVIGGTSPSDANVISGNQGGIVIYGSDNLIEGNFIGTDSTGNNPVSNTEVGVFITIGASNNT
jgi:hypothetical protein